MPLDPADKKLVQAWDEEIEKEEAEDHELWQAGLRDERARRAQSRSALAAASAKLLQAAGLTEADARRLADEDLERARKGAQMQRKRAGALLDKRIQAAQAEAKNVVAGAKGGR